MHFLASGIPSTGTQPWQKGAMFQHFMLGISLCFGIPFVKVRAVKKLLGWIYLPNLLEDQLGVSILMKSDHFPQLHRGKTWKILQNHQDFSTAPSRIPHCNTKCYFPIISFFPTNQPKTAPNKLKHVFPLCYFFNSLQTKTAASRTVLSKKCWGY